MFAKVRKEYGLDLPLSVLMEAPTLGGFADVVRDELGIEPPAKTVATAAGRSPETAETSRLEGVRAVCCRFSGGFFGSLKRYTRREMGPSAAIVR